MPLPNGTTLLLPVQSAQDAIQRAMSHATGGLHDPLLQVPSPTIEPGGGWPVGQFGKHKLRPVVGSTHGSVPAGIIDNPGLKRLPQGIQNVFAQALAGLSTPWHPNHTAAPLRRRVRRGLEAVTNEAKMRAGI